MTAEIVSVGTELLLGQIVDTNAAAMGRILAECGVAHQHRQTVGDNIGRATQAILLALSRSEIVIAIGGLGPTEDDLTRQAIAGALDEPLVLDEEVLAGLRAFVARRGSPWVEALGRQAMRPGCGEAIPNAAGTAPGLVCRKAGKTVLALPGPAAEFLPMAEGPVRQILTELGGGEVILSRVIRVCGMGESAVVDRLGELMDGDNPTLAPYAKPAEVHLRVTARAASREAAMAMMEPVAAALAARLGSAIYGEGDTTLEAAIVALLRERGATLSTAESLTAGMLASRIGSVPGASSVYLGGAVAYSWGAKESLLDVPRETLRQSGTVSRECALAMARGARARLATEIAVSTTGEAGPQPIEAEVGLVYAALADEKGEITSEGRFRGSRDDIRTRATQLALVLLRRRLLGELD